ncbi:MAG TPA: hypothetical protein VFU41_01810 [Gemmatimonadales bacterium]|nr:hypothetical protein [Gemmatimonadales bacterium]
MRTLLCAVLVVTACAPGERKAAAPSSAQKYVGTWEGRSYRSASDTGVSYQVVMALVADGSLRGTLTYPGSTLPPAPIRVREFSETSIVQELGPFYSRLANREVVARAVGQVQGDSLNGTFELRPPEGGEVLLTGTFRAKRVS